MVVYVFNRSTMIQSRRRLTTVICCAVASRIATIALMILANELLPTHDAGGIHTYRSGTFPVPTGPGVGGALSSFTRWDAAWFLSIADSGYPTATPPKHTQDMVDCARTKWSWGAEEYSLEGQHRRPCLGNTPLEEQAHAFFPLYPCLVRWTGAALQRVGAPRGLVAGKADSLVLAAVLVSNLCFVAAAVLLYRLGAVVTGDALLAFRGALAFCATPASVFFSTAYAESLYAALSFGGLLVLLSEGRRRRTSPASGGASRRHHETSNAFAVDGSSGKVWKGAFSAWIAAALLALATLTRSNGIAGAGVLVLEKLRWMADEVGIFSAAKHEHEEEEGAEAETATTVFAARAPRKSRRHGGGSALELRSRWVDFPWLTLMASTIATFLQALLVVSPYVLVQAYAYRKFCLAVGQSEEILTAQHPWCAWRVPSVYAYVQSTYWGVGALRYYQWKQIPNFLLAAPSLLLTAYGTMRFFSAQHHGLPRGPADGAGGEERGAVITGQGKFGEARRWNWCPERVERLLEVFFGPAGLPRPGSHPFERRAAAALVLQWGFLGVFAALCMNVQVATRFLAAACPPLHWWTARLLVRNGSGTRVGNCAVSSFVGSSLRWYMALYFVVGAVLHANFLPWT